MLEVSALNAFYGKSHILQGVEFNVQQGEIVSLLGRNGVGRSTTVKSIIGEVSPLGSIKFKGEEIAGLAAKLRLTKIQKEQRVRRYQIEYENLQNEIENELVKIEKIQDDFEIAEDMTDLKALTFGERISFASDILTSQLRILENYYQQYEILIDVLSLKGGFSDMFEIEYASLRRTQ